MKTFTYALRHLKRARAYTVINLLGLSLSLACCIVLMRYIHRELTVDTHCVDRDRTVLVLGDMGGNVYPVDLKSRWAHPDTTYIPDDQIVDEARFVLLQNDNVLSGEHSFKMNVMPVDSAFLHFFRYRLVEGEYALAAPDAAILTRRCARRLFGSESPIGQVLTYAGETVVVRGVVEEPDCKTTYHWDMLVNYELKKLWQRASCRLMRALPSVDLDAVNARSYVYKTYENEDVIMTGTKEEVRYHFITQRQLYFDRTINIDNLDDILHRGNLGYVRLLCGVVALLLLVGVLNFVNLYMVMLMKRSREYGVKKVFGLQGFHLFSQIYAENILLGAAALLLAWFGVELMQPFFNRFVDDAIGYSAFDGWVSLAFLLLFPLLTSVYPFIRYQYRPPMVSLRVVGTTRQSVGIRMAFLFVQYVVTLLLIMLSLYFVRHLRLMLDTPPGFRVENVMTANLFHEDTQVDYEDEDYDKNRRARAQRIIQRIEECPYVDRFLFTRNTPLTPGNVSPLLNDREQEAVIQLDYVSPDYFRFYDIPLLEGNLEELEKNSAEQMVLNRAAMDAFGYKTKEDAFVRSESPLWLTVSSQGEIVRGGTKLMPVVAVVDNFYAGRVSEGIKPMAWVVRNGDGGERVQLAVKPDKVNELLDYLRDMEQEVYRTDEFTYTWLKDEVSALYENDRRIVTVYSVFALIAIVVSALGLLGISLFDIRQRFREIGIRKVNGARLRDLIPLLSRKYAVVLGLAFVVAVPVAYYIIYVYTADFVVKASVGVGIFLVALMVVIAVSFGTLWGQVRKAARVNPAEVMKSE